MEKFPINLFVSAALPLCYGVLPEPPDEEVSVGYRRWMTDDPEAERVSCRVDYFVRPDGSARIHSEDEVGVEDEILPRGAWSVEAMHYSFGSRGGREIVPLRCACEHTAVAHTYRVHDAVSGRYVHLLGGCAECPDDEGIGCADFHPL